MDRVFIDEETGEILAYQQEAPVVSAVNDAETGEPEVTVEIGQGPRRTRFQIPRKVKEELSLKENAEKSNGFMEIEPVPVGASFGQINPIFLFLPAIIYFQWFTSILIICEVILHVWAHHKNKTLNHASVYFRSPFHDMSAEFCTLCQNEKCMNRVGILQEMRMNKFLKQCNYMKRVVT
ncbi:uncharacterized protein LOC107263308 [Cephus cinctus]|uniref:Uncharacterized protein LOC107263308 n=1 Tax=Cephus cinctus TaxID=211228 RepID=A0AAJ7FD41_CEPCN|nr:uncharacterized protein LOC107263308 [Cephus cinctus]XP_015585849.1 uncharacterized protein LOC107263308 [Cephus cinctus]